MSFLASVKAHIKRPGFHVSLWKFIFLEVKHLNLNNTYWNGGGDNGCGSELLGVTSG